MASTAPSGGGVSSRHTGNLQVRAVYDEQGKDIELVISNRLPERASAWQQ
jgi:hypothetical protein